jgi:hypothetical protein
MKYFLGLALVLFPFMGQSQTLEFVGIQIILNQKPDMVKSMLEQQGFTMTANKRSNPQEKEYDEISFMEFKKGETNPETVVFVEATGGNKINYLFSSNAHFVKIKNQINKSYSLKTSENHGGAIMEEYSSSYHQIMLTQMTKFKQYSFFVKKLNK